MIKREREREGKKVKEIKGHDRSKQICLFISCPFKTEQNDMYLKPSVVYKKKPINPYKHFVLSFQQG